MPAFDFEKKFDAFGFDAKTIKGNDVEAIYDAITAKTDKPKAIILDNVKGSGVKEIEETAANHSMTVDQEVFDGWLESLRADLAKIQKEA